MTDSAATAAVPVGGLVHLTALGALVGVPVDLLAFCFLLLVHELGHPLWHELPTALGSAGPPW